MSSSRLSLSFRSGGGFPRFFLLTIVFVELLCTTTAMMRVTATVTSAASPRFPFFALSRMWPGSSCLGRVGTCSSNTSTAEADVRRFMVHGLWPDYTNGSYPQFCGKFDPSCPQFDLQDLQQEVPQLVREMTHEWSGLYSDNSLFWKHEWDKHGTCAYLDTEIGAISSVGSFFAWTMWLHEANDLTNAIEKHGMSPGSVVRLDDIRSAVTAELGSTPVINCAPSPDPKLTHGLPILAEIWMCIGASVEGQYLAPLDSFPKEYLAYWNDPSYDRLQCGGEHAQVFWPAPPF